MQSPDIPEVGTSGDPCLDPTWVVTETESTFVMARKSPYGFEPMGTVLAECPDHSAADRVSEGLQALTRLCTCGAVHTPRQDVERLRALARRLVRLDDPLDPAGVADRQTINLTAIVEAARDALGGVS